jgi:hypothetical protein
MSRQHGVIYLGLMSSLLILGGCDPGEESPAKTPKAATTSQSAALCGQNTPATVIDYAHPSDLPHGISGDRRLVFVTLPLSAQVQVLDRFTGQQVATLPPPPSGFLLPFALRSPRDGHLVVLDAGGFPSPFAPSIPVVYDYDYTYDQHHGFNATITRSVSFAGLPLVFAEDVEVLDDGTYVVSESVIGGLWLINPDGTIVPGVFPDDPGAPLTALTGCPIPNITVDGVPFDIGFAPGVNNMAHRGGQLYFGSSCLGGLYRIPIHSLRAGSSPSARANDIVTVSPRPANTIETLEGLAFDQSGFGDKIYANDTFHLQLLRIDVHTGAREVVAADPILFDFPVAITALPEVHGQSPLIVSSDQEYRLAAFNPGITQNEFLLPFHLTEVLVHP